ncbi:MAG: alpha/beta fold hydrolase [Pseudomonadaceae bacterium]|nr:alpha/beta fold hydrolase [Pseudomonadaceae bacterium]
MNKSLLMLPGAVADASFWQPVAALLPPHWPKRLLHWPGLGAQAHSPLLRSLDETLDWAAAGLSEPSVLIAQSMGALVALHLCLRYPDKVSHLVLCAPSAGIDLQPFGAEDWRPAYQQNYPQAQPWILEQSTDLSQALGRLQIPTLLISGDHDRISPIGVSQQLHRLIPKAQLQIISGGGHDLAKTHANLVAELIQQLLQRA